MNPKVDFYFLKAKKWQEEIVKMRDIAIACGLTEELKWGCPCYTYNKSNIVLIHIFKEYCAFLFFKGALLKDSKGILVQQTENVQSARQIRFSNLKNISKAEHTLKAYIHEAIEVENAGLKVALKSTKGYTVPTEFETSLKKSAALKAAFKDLTPGRQRGYLLYFSQAKQSATRQARIQKCIPKILNGEGLND